MNDEWYEISAATELVFYYLAVRNIFVVKWTANILWTTHIDRGR